MSAIGGKADTWDERLVMSAFDPKRTNRHAARECRKKLYVSEDAPEEVLGVNSQTPNLETFHACY